MALNLKSPEADELRPRITVFGVGGAGGNAVNNMIEKNLEGAEFVVANTDAQALQQTRSSRRLQLGVGVTQGLGAGARPDVGGAAAEESLDEIVQHLDGSHMCFITAGMGGGTGTGAAPVIARAAREMGILTVGVVTKPFQFEGTKRMTQADSGIDALQQVVDTLIIIPNQNLFRIANERTTFAEAFMMADDVLYQGVKGVTDLMVRPGLINLDFADVRSVMDEMGKAMMGTGEAEGETRAIDAAEKAIANPLLDEVSLKGAKGVLINITGGYDLTLFELDEAANRIRTEVDPEANIIVGSTLDPEMEGAMRVSVVATGIDAQAVEESQPRPSERRPATTARIVPATAEAPRRASAVAELPVADPEPEPAMRAESAPPARPVQKPALQPVQTAQREPEPEPNLFAEPEPSQDASFIAPAPVEPGDPRADAPDPAPRPAPQPRRAAHAGDPTPFTVAGMRQAAEATEADRGRFGLNSLIHRMTGGGGAKTGAAALGRAEPAAAQAVARRDPAPSYGRPVIDERHEEPADDDEDLRMEIPAFLRRQAN
ncbi:cell division protein FtsZ [Pikeienuella piscinae]|uniref:Cell division protein FtsZ n=1 Tax=Pikeienuella piscinae TaxID=2748098 RepID=A0A7M3T6M6_9RHOB|nr:cell division protein FtsZ [Pikeienuella piscinae]QIE57657.1 cell division protein FtsZ [Pikeienuella piscinae]